MMDFKRVTRFHKCQVFVASVALLGTATAARPAFAGNSARNLSSFCATLIDELDKGGRLSDRSEVCVAYFQGVGDALLKQGGAGPKNPCMAAHYLNLDDLRHPRIFQEYLKRNPKRGDDFASDVIRDSLVEACRQSTLDNLSTIPTKFDENAAKSIKAPQFATPEEVRTYARQLVSGDTKCTESRENNFLTCREEKAHGLFEVREKYDVRERILGIQINVVNASHPIMDDYRVSKLALEGYVQRYILPFLSSLELSADSVRQCTNHPDLDQATRFRLSFNDRTYVFSCSYISGDFGYGLTYILVTDFK